MAGERSGNAVSDPVRLARIRWRCRRGLLENDLILARFLDAKGATLSDDEVAMLDRLLDLPDNELWDLIAGRAEPADGSVRPLVEQLRRS
jgi:antitoxin CptB